MYIYSKNVGRHAGKAWIAHNEARGWEEAEEGGRARGAPETVISHAGLSISTW